MEIMAKKTTKKMGKVKQRVQDVLAVPKGLPLAVVDTWVVFCRDSLEQLKKLPEGCVDLIYIDLLFRR